MTAPAMPADLARLLDLVTVPDLPPDFAAKVVARALAQPYPASSTVQSFPPGLGHQRWRRRGRARWWRGALVLGSATLLAVTAAASGWFGERISIPVLSPLIDRIIGPERAAPPPRPTGSPAAPLPIPSPEPGAVGAVEDARSIPPPVIGPRLEQAAADRPPSVAARPSVPLPPAQTAQDGRAAPPPPLPVRALPVPPGKAQADMAAPPVQPVTPATILDEPADLGTRRADERPATARAEPDAAADSSLRSTPPSPLPSPLPPAAREVSPDGPERLRPEPQRRAIPPVRPPQPARPAPPPPPARQPPAARRAPGG